MSADTQDNAGDQANGRKVWWALGHTVETGYHLLGFCERTRVRYPGAPGAVRQLAHAQARLLAIDGYEEDNDSDHQNEGAS